MSMTIHLTPEETARLEGEAAALGMQAEDLARRLIVEHLPLHKRQQAIQLLRSWREEDAAIPPEEAEAELREFKEAMNANRNLTGEEPLYP